MESVWALQGHNPIVELSTQQVVSCDSKSSGCNGGGHDRAVEYVLRAGGLETDSDYTYGSGSDDITGKCNFVAKSIFARFQVWLKSEN